MFWVNTKLLFRLYYRPVSAMSAIIDEGHWLYAAVSVIAISLLLQAAITSLIYSSYEAIYRPLPEAAHEQAASQQQRPVTPDYPTAEEQFDDADYEQLGLAAPTYVFDQKPMPLV